MSSPEFNVRYCFSTHDNVSKLVENTAESSKNISESNEVNTYLEVSLSLTQLSVGNVYVEEVLCNRPHKTFDVAHFNDTMFTLEDCRALTKSMA